MSLRAKCECVTSPNHWALVGVWCETSRVTAGKLRSGPLTWRAVVMGGISANIMRIEVKQWKGQREKTEFLGLHGQELHTSLDCALLNFLYVTVVNIFIFFKQILFWILHMYRHNADWYINDMPFWASHRSAFSSGNTASFKAESSSQDSCRPHVLFESGKQ